MRYRALGSLSGGDAGWGGTVREDEPIGSLVHVVLRHDVRLVHGRLVVPGQSQQHALVSYSCGDRAICRALTPTGDSHGRLICNSRGGPKASWRYRAGGGGAGRWYRQAVRISGALRRALALIVSITALIVRPGAGRQTTREQGRTGEGPSPCHRSSCALTPALPSPGGSGTGRECTHTRTHRCQKHRRRAGACPRPAWPRSGGRSESAG